MNNQGGNGWWIFLHEFRTPLAVLRGEIEAIQNGIREVNDERLASIHAEVLNLGKLIEDIYQLLLSNIGALKYQKLLIKNPFFIGRYRQKFSYSF